MFRLLRALPVLLILPSSVPAEIPLEIGPAEGSSEAEHERIADAILPAEEPVKSDPPAKPNIVLLMADDLGWSDTTPYLPEDEDFYETPAIAKLARQGTRFTNAYAASPLCSPTRASVLTGQYPGRIRLTTPNCHTAQVVLDPVVPESAPPHKPLLEPGTRTRFPNTYVTIAERLKAIRYATAFVGKWHLGRAPYLPDNQGFDLVIGGREHPGPPGGFFAPWPIDTIRPQPAGTHIDDAIATETIEWLRARKPDEPFFLNLWFYSVHAPFEAKPELIEKYRNKAAGLPGEAPRNNPVMAAMIETLDENVGRILEALDDRGIAENTLVIFTSDNGGNEYNLVEGITPTNNAPLAYGKGNIGEGGQRVPFIMRWPDVIPAGATSESLVSSVDIFPTILAATGQSPAPAQTIDGINLLEPVPPDRAVFCHFPHSPAATGTNPACSVRRGQWKLTRYFPDRLELFDLNADPGESRSLTKAHPEVAAELDALISAHLDETQALVPRPNPRYQLTVEGWVPGGETELNRDDGILNVRTADNDPRFSTSEFGPARGRVSVEVEFATDIDPATPIHLYWGTQYNPGIGRDRLAPFRRLTPRTYRIDLNLPENDRLRTIRIDPGKSPGEILINEIRLIAWKDEARTTGKNVRLWSFQ